MNRAFQRVISNKGAAGIDRMTVDQLRKWIDGQGTPQGGPLSPLLSNLLLDDLDKELERRGHAFCRYADACNIYVQSRKSGERVMESVSLFLKKKGGFKWQVQHPQG